LHFSAIRIHQIYIFLRKGKQIIINIQIIIALIQKFC